MILHIAERSEWEPALSRAEYEPADFAEEGFIHCSEPWQAQAIADRMFRGRDDLVLLVIDEKRLGVEVRRENLLGGEELFPHVYGRIESDAVVGVRDLEVEASGRLSIPADLVEGVD